MGVTQLSMIEALKKGETRAYEWLKNIVEPFIHGVLIQRGVRNLHDREEFSQQALVRIVDTISKFEYRKAGSFSSWSATIARNIWIDYQRSRQGHERSRQVSIENFEAPSPEMVRSLDSQLSLIVAQSVLKLMQSECIDEQEQRAFSIYQDYVETVMAGSDNSTSVVASRYSMTTQQLNTHIFRIRKKLKARIETELGFPFPNF